MAPVFDTYTATKILGEELFFSFDVDGVGELVRIAELRGRNLSQPSSSSVSVMNKVKTQTANDSAMTLGFVQSTASCFYSPSLGMKLLTPSSHSDCLLSHTYNSESPLLSLRATPLLSLPALRRISSAKTSDRHANVSTRVPNRYPLISFTPSSVGKRAYIVHHAYNPG